MDEQAAQIRRELDGRLQLADKIARVRNTLVMNPPILLQKVIKIDINHSNLHGIFSFGTNDIFIFPVKRLLMKKLTEGWFRLKKAVTKSKTLIFIIGSSPAL